MKTKLLLIIVYSALGILCANAQNYQWAKNIGDVNCTGAGYSIAVDGVGNIYVTGGFIGTADFDPGAGTANLTSTSGGGNDIFFAKYDNSGNYLWAKSIGSGGGDIAYSIAVDGAGNAYLTGSFGVTVDFDPGSGTATLTPMGNGDIFLAKYDNMGNYLWAKSIGGSGQDLGRNIVVDGAGNPYLTGYFTGTADFDAGAAIANLTSAGTQDIFFAKYDSSGNYLWAKNIGGIGDDQGFSIAVDGTGNAYLAGSFIYTGDFDPGAGTANLTSAGSADIFYAKYDSSGNYLWAINIGSTGGDIGYSIVLDGVGNVYLTGHFTGTADFDSGVGTANLTSAGGNDIFLAKYNNAGNYLWAKNIGSTGSDIGYSIALDGAGNIYLTGYFTGTGDFDPGAGTANLTSAGSADIFFAKYDNSGNYLWSKSIGSVGYDIGKCIVLDGLGNVYLTGSFEGTADFDPGAGTANLTSAGSADIYFAKYAPLLNSINETANLSALVKVYPNPGNGMLNVQWLMANGNTSTISYQPLTIEVYNVFGEKMYEQDIINKQTTNSGSPNGLSQFAIDLRTAPSGIYFLDLKTEHGTVTKKIIINK